MLFPKGRRDGGARGPLEPAPRSAPAGATPGEPANDRGKEGRGPAGAREVIAEVAKRHRYWLSLIDRHLPQVARSLVEAADVLQETYVRVLRRSGPFAGMSPEELEVWFLKLIARVVQDETRKSKRREALGRLAAIRRGLHRGQRRAGDDDGDVGPECPWPGPEEQLSRAEEGERVLGALRSLPFELRFVLVIRHLGGYSVREISGALRISPKIVSSRLGHAREALLAALEHGGGRRS